MYIFLGTYLQPSIKHNSLITENKKKLYKIKYQIIFIIDR